MPTDTLISLPSIASSHALATDLRPAIGADEDQKLQGDVYDGSSSLSEIEDRAGTEHPSHGCSDANDTEAETERLEDSPQKQRTHQNLLLTATTSIHDHHQSPSTTHALSTRVRRHGQPNASNDSVGLADALLALDSVGDRLEQNSDISFLEASGEEHGQAVSPTPSSPMKRKRSSFGNDSASDQEIPQEPSVKAMKFLRGTSARDLPSLDAKTSPDALLEQDDQELFAGIARLPISQNESRKAELPSKQKHMKGKRKVKKIPDDEPTDAVNVGSAVQSPVQRNADTVHSNEDDAQIEGVVDGPEADNPVKTEELIEKRTALDSLSAIEKCFAKLRDKLFDERLAQCNEELAMLEQPIPTHPELRAMKEVIDLRRDQKIDYEQNLKRLKLMTLQRESIASKSQAHAQYMQTVREVRDTYLDKLNREYYQIQRERRSGEDEIPDYVYKFTAKRSQQLKNQAAYNTEISLLSGVAKYVGFPAAPEISKARPKEIDDDLRNMGISPPGESLAMRNHQPAFKASLSTTASFPRRRTGPDQYFLEQNPWAANPQHPTHHPQRQQMHRQVSDLSGLSRAATPSTTPAGQRRFVDLTEPQGSASTIAEAQSRLISSMAPTPIPGEAARVTQSGQNSAMSPGHVDSTPSRNANGTQMEAKPSLALLDPLIAAANQTAMAHSSWSEQNPSSSIPRNVSVERKTPGALPKPLQFTDGSSSTPGMRTSTPVRYPVIKAEDHSVVSRKSPIPHEFHIATPLSTIANGQRNPFAT